MERQTEHQRFEPGLLSRLPEPRKVALLRASRIGDFVCATPAFRALRQAMPEAEITLIALPLVRELVARNTELDRFVAFPGWPGIAEQFYDPERAHEVLEGLRAERFDVAIQLHGSGFFSNQFLQEICAGVSAGFVRPGDGGAGLDAALPMPGGNERDRLLALVRFLGAPAHRVSTEFPLVAQDHTAAAALLDGLASPLIGVHPGARNPSQRWPLENFLAAAGILSASMGGTVIVVGEERQGVLPGVVDLRGQTSLSVLGAVLDRLAVLLTNDSGPAHIAYALGTPSVTIFGATDPVQWGPPAGPHRVVMKEVHCRPCGAPVCYLDRPCTNEVSIALVCEAAISAMQEDPRREQRRL